MFFQYLGLQYLPQTLDLLKHVSIGSELFIKNRCHKFFTFLTAVVYTFLSFLHGSFNGMKGQCFSYDITLFSGSENKNFTTSTILFFIRICYKDHP